ncbi:MAG: glycosyl transferase [Bacteroidetes bacterium]|jgi:cellulose synthase/poly-beta-1,6-N-acetylglucosamine synthase-like glycosyltransferase|nr:glycosyl transferase [Bacteroidota bacterium]
MIIGTLAISIALLYFLYLLLLAVSWTNNRLYVAGEPENHTPVSILIPCRNEETTIAACLDSIARQHYPAHKVQVILVDDHSEDRTIDLAKQYPFVKILQLPEGTIGKKNALDLGIREAIHELIITRDADTVCNEEWLAVIISAYEKTKAPLIICPVFIRPSFSLLNALQRLEHFALTILGGGTAYLKKPVLCNGANLCFTKTAFREVKGYEGNETIASGDDIFLMNKIRNIKGPGILYLKNRDAGVYTSVPGDLRTMFHQRLRWAQKSRKSSSFLSGFSGFLIALCTILLLTSGILSVFYTELTPYFTFTAILKCFIDFLLLFLAASFYQQRKVLIAFPLMVLIYPFYVVWIAIAVYTTKAEWKGRRTN